MIWYSGPDAPTADMSDPSSNFILSEMGADMFVETDCDNTGCSGTPTTPSYSLESAERWLAPTLGYDPDA